jgi:hypothetical protein
MVKSGDCLEWRYEDIQDDDPNLYVGCGQFCAEPSQIIGQQVEWYWLESE